MMLQLSVRRFMALYLTVFGYLGDAYGGTVLTNSNNIKHLSGGIGGVKLDYAVSPSPRTSTMSSIGQKLPVENVQPNVCLDDDECGADEFCNDSRGVCLPCRKNRKRCARDSMCCAGNRCINGVCQVSDIEGMDAVTADIWQRHNNTMDLHSRKSHAQGHQPHSVKGGEGDTCLRSSDCLADLCCARHFWSRICKPVLTEGLVCTRHKRKGSHGLELFQRCDCGDGLACRPEKVERETVVSRTAARNLHTCQKR